MAVNIVSLIAGTRGVGKTDFIKENIKSVVKKDNNKKVLIVDTFDNPVWKDLGTYKAPGHQISTLSVEDLPRWKKGIYLMPESDTNRAMEMIEKHLYNCLLIFEDATKYIGTRLTDETRKFIIDSKQKNLDIIFVFHSLIDIPKQLIRVSDLLTIFKTNEAYTSYMRSRYPWQYVETAFKEVQKSQNRHEKRTIRIGS